MRNRFSCPDVSGQFGVDAIRLAARKPRPRLHIDKLAAKFSDWFSQTEGPTADAGM